MTRRVIELRTVFVLIVVGCLGAAVSGQIFVGAPTARSSRRRDSHPPRRRMAPLQRRSERQRLLAAGSDRRFKLQQAPGRVALQNRRLRPVP